MSLQNFLSTLTLEQLKELCADMTEAGIKKELKHKYRDIFKSKRKLATGKRKKIYAALAKTSNDDMDRVIDALIEFNNSLKR